MNDDPNQIVSFLTERHGFDGALEAVRSGIGAAHANGDNYRLSVWREINRALNARRDAADRPKPQESGLDDSVSRASLT